MPFTLNNHYKIAG